MVMLCFVVHDGRTVCYIRSQISQLCCFCFTLQKQEHQLYDAIESEIGQHCDRNEEENNGGGGDNDDDDSLWNYLFTFISKGLSNHLQRLL